MSEKQTAKNALDILCRYDAKFRRLNSQERKNLATAFAREGKVVYGRAFDLVKCNKPIDFANQSDILRNFNSIVV